MDGNKPPIATGPVDIFVTEKRGSNCSASDGPKTREIQNCWQIFSGKHSRSTEEQQLKVVVVLPSPVLGITAQGKDCWCSLNLKTIVCLAFQRQKALTAVLPISPTMAIFSFSVEYHWNQTWEKMKNPKI